MFFYHGLARYSFGAAPGSITASVFVSFTPRTLTPFIHTNDPGLRHPRPSGDPYRDATAARVSHAASPLQCVFEATACQTSSPPTIPMRPDLPYNPQPIAHHHPAPRRFPCRIAALPQHFLQQTRNSQLRFRQYRRSSARQRTADSGPLLRIAAIGCPPSTAQPHYPSRQPITPLRIATTATGLALPSSGSLICEGLRCPPRHQDGLCCPRRHKCKASHLRRQRWRRARTSAVSLRLTPPTND